MSGTIRTDSYLTTTEFQDGQADGSITASDMRDLIASKVNVGQVRSTKTANYTLVLADYSACIEMDATTATTLTVPPNSSAAFPVGTWIDVYKKNTGNVVITPGAGVTIRTPSSLTLATQYATVRIIKRATDEWVLVSQLPFGTIIGNPPPNISNTTAVSAGTDVLATGLSYTYAPTATWDGLTGGFLTRMYLQGTASSTGSAHVVAGTHFLTVQNTGGTLILAIGGEHRAQIDGAGVTVNALVVSEHNLGDVASGSTVGLATICNNHLGDWHGTATAGIVGTGLNIDNLHANVPLIAAHAALAPLALNGTVTTFANLYMPDFGTIPGTGGITNKFFTLNQDRNAVSQTSGRTILASGREAASPAHGGIEVGRYYFGISPQQPLTTLVLYAGYAIASPFFCPHRQTFTKIGCEVTAGVASSNVQLAIYSVSGGTPNGAPIYTGANHSSAAAAVIEETGLSITLEAGVYWLFLGSDAAVTVRSYTDHTGGGTVGFDTSNTSGNSYPAFAVTLNTGTPASTWPSNPSLIYGSGFNNNFPQVWLRA